MTDSTRTPGNNWNVILIEDEDTVRRQVSELLQGMSFESRGFNITEYSDIDQAINLIHEHKADLIILDVYRGVAQTGGKQSGIDVLESIKRTGFVPVILYTALPEGLDQQQSAFIRLVGKESRSLDRLKTEIEDLFRLHIPQVHRSIINHLDRSLCSYMWEFVQSKWGEFEPLVNKPEFLRLIIQRLALSFSRDGIDTMISEVYGLPEGRQVSSGEIIHPAEYYIKPPVGKDPMLGDIRLRRTGESIEYLIILWPTCDMVTIGKREPKTNLVLCVRSCEEKEIPEIESWIATPTVTNQRKIERLIKNTRDESQDRYHFLPGVWNIPDLILDFQKIENLSLSDITQLECIATLASPFAEALASRFQKYIGRIGTPDLDLTSVLDHIRSTMTPKREATSS